MRDSPPLSVAAVYRAERRYPKESREIKENIYQKSVQFFRESW